MVYLTGAGPGDVELLTLKAYKVIQQADIIIYDRLANEEILKEAKDGCEFVYVGKARANHKMAQEDINELIYKSSLKYDTVVRLKGGDPFVFGRGYEEFLYLQERDVTCEVISGVTSAISVPASANIPVTHRGVSVGFRVVTGHEAKKDISQIEWESFKTDETIVFLMGLHNLKNITQNLIKIGKSRNYPCAVISKGTTKEQQVVKGNLENIYEKAKHLPTPALIVVGRVVELESSI